MSLNPIDHTAEANRLLRTATCNRDTVTNWHSHLIARAQVHATLAMAESLRAIVKTDEAIEGARQNGVNVVMSPGASAAQFHAALIEQQRRQARIQTTRRQA